MYEVTHACSHSLSSGHATLSSCLQARNGLPARYLWETARQRCLEPGLHQVYSILSLAFRSVRVRLPCPGGGGAHTRGTLHCVTT